MKNIVFTLLFLSFAFSLNAQILKGSIPLTASVSFYTQHQSDPRFINFKYKSTSTNYLINPSIGYFIADNLSAGIGLSYSYSNSSTTTDFDTVLYTIKINRQALQIAPYLSHYIKLSDQFYFSITGSCGYQFTLHYHQTGDNTADDKEDQSYQIKGNITPGIVYFINNKFALLANIGSIYYTYSHEKDLGSYSDKSEGGLSFNLSTLNLGVQYFIVRK